MRNVCAHTDLPLYTVAHLASLSPAKAIREDHRKGSLEAGKDADILIADADFRILKTFVGGVCRYEA